MRKHNAQQKLKALLVCSLFSCVGAITCFGQALGDVNNDNMINILDAMLVAQYAVHFNPTNFSTTAADVDCSGTIDIVDALTIARYSCGLMLYFPCATPGPTPSGTPVSAYQYTPVTTFLPVFGTTDLSFGRILDISADGNTILAGIKMVTYVSEGVTTHQDSVFLYRRQSTTSPWEETEIATPEIEEQISHGHYIAVSRDGNTFIIADPDSKDANGIKKGAVYVYRRNSTSGQLDRMKLVASDGQVDDLFGRYSALSEDGNTIVVGLPFDPFNPKTGYAGAVYTYKWNSTQNQWGETKLSTVDGVDKDQYGRAVALSGDGNLVLVGSSRYNATLQSWYADTAYLYRWNSTANHWEEVKRFSAPLNVSRISYGSCLGLSEDGKTAFIPCVYASDETNRTWTHIAYIYRQNVLTGQWDETSIPVSNYLNGYIYNLQSALTADGNTFYIGTFENVVPVTGSNQDKYLYSRYIYRWNDDAGLWEEYFWTAESYSQYDYLDQAVAMTGDGSMMLAGMSLNYPRMGTIRFYQYDATPSYTSRPPTYTPRPYITPTPAY